jgi:hypothetical protein
MTEPSTEAAVVRPVFVDLSGHRRLWMRFSAMTMAAAATAFIAGAAFLLGERPFTARPELIVDATAPARGAQANKAAAALPIVGSRAPKIITGKPVPGGGAPVGQVPAAPSTSTEIPRVDTEDPTPVPALMTAPPVESPTAMPAGRTPPADTDGP